jgi:hypothetical protein
MRANWETLFAQQEFSEFIGKHFCFPGSEFCFRNNVSRGGQTGKHYQEAKFLRNNASLFLVVSKAFSLNGG